MDREEVGGCTVYNQENAMIKFPPVKAEWGEGAD